MLPDEPEPFTVCMRCNTVHQPHALSKMSMGTGGAAPGYRCAVAVAQGKGLGGYGSTVADMDTVALAPAAGLHHAAGFLCDGCFEALETVGVLEMGPPLPVQPKAGLIWDTTGTERFDPQINDLLQRFVKGTTR